MNMISQTETLNALFCVLHGLHRLPVYERPSISYKEVNLCERRSLRKSLHFS